MLNNSLLERYILYVNFCASSSITFIIDMQVDVEKMRRTEGVLSEHNSSSTKPYVLIYYIQLFLISTVL